MADYWSGVSLARVAITTVLVVSVATVASAGPVYRWRADATGDQVNNAGTETGATGSLAIGSIEFFAKIPVYYGHERLWQLLPRGTVRKATMLVSEPSPLERLGGRRRDGATRGAQRRALERSRVATEVRSGVRRDADQESKDRAGRRRRQCVPRVRTCAGCGRCDRG